MKYLREVLLKYFQELYKHTVFLKLGSFPADFAVVSKQDCYLSNLQQRLCHVQRLKKKGIQNCCKTCY